MDTFNVLLTEIWLEENLVKLKSLNVCIYVINSESCPSETALLRPEHPGLL